MPCVSCSTVIAEQSIGFVVTLCQFCQHQMMLHSLIHRVFTLQIQFARVDASGVQVDEPVELDTNWDVAKDVTH